MDRRTILAYALGQVIHYDYPESYRKKRCESYEYITPKRLSCSKVEVADSYFALDFLQRKIYIYRLYNGEVRNPFTRTYASWHPYPLDIDRLRSFNVYRGNMILPALLR